MKLGVLITSSGNNGFLKNIKAKKDIIFGAEGVFPGSHPLCSMPSSQAIKGIQISLSPLSVVIKMQGGFHHPYGEADHPAQGGISLGKDRNYSHSMKFTRDLIIVNYFKWKMLDIPWWGKGIKRERE